MRQYIAAGLGGQSFYVGLILLQCLGLGLEISGLQCADFKTSVVSLACFVALLKRLPLGLLLCQAVAPLGKIVLGFWPHRALTLAVVAFQIHFHRVAGTQARGLGQEGGQCKGGQKDESAPPHRQGFIQLMAQETGVPGQGSEHAVCAVQEAVYPSVARNGLPMPVDHANAQEHWQTQEETRPKDEGQLPHGAPQEVEIAVVGHQGTGVEPGEEICLLQQRRLRQSVAEGVFPSQHHRPGWPHQSPVCHRLLEEPEDNPQEEGPQSPEDQVKKPKAADGHGICKVLK